MRKDIEVASYNSNWPQIFKEEAKIIKEALEDNCVEVYHIGSTAVPGLIAKPKIDIIAVVKNGKASAGSLEKVGYDYRGEYNIPMHYGFAKRDLFNFNLHVYEEWHPEIELNLCFRDYLRTNEQAREEYTFLKKQILDDESSFFLKNDSPFTNYTLRKGDFIRKILKQAGFNRLRMLKVNDETEITAAKHFRQKYFFGPYGIDDPYIWTFGHQQHAHLVLYQGTEIVGYAHVQFWPEKRSAIRIIVIDEYQRQKNAGSMFLALCEKWLKSLDITSIHAESRPSSLQFYIKNGYVEMPFNDPEEHESGPEDIAVGKVLR